MHADRQHFFSAIYCLLKFRSFDERGIGMLVRLMSLSLTILYERVIRSNTAALSSRSMRVSEIVVSTADRTQSQL